MVAEIKTFSPVSTGLGGLCVGLLGMWFTAMSERGVSRSDMESYVKNYSPYVMERTAIMTHQTIQDRDMAKLIAQHEMMIGRLDKLEKKIDGP